MIIGFYIIIQATMEKRNLPSIYEEEFLKYLQEKGRNHHSYKMYTTIDIVNSTIEKEALYLSNGDNWNDRIDRENFNNNGLVKMNFGRCFSYSGSESVAMWMLYGGMKHKGAMIDFDKISISEILTNTKHIGVGYFDNDEFVTLKNLDKCDFEIQLIDVVYTETNHNIMIIRRTMGDKWEINVPLDFQKCILNGEKGKIIHKSKAWDYEQECRLIVSVKKEKLQDLQDYNKIQMVRIDLHSINLKNVRRIYAPNIGSGNKLKTEFQKAHPSNLINEVDWDLCHGCK